MAPQTGSKKTVAPAFDFTAVKPTAAPAPTRQVGVTASDNPALPWVRKSWSEKQPKATVNGEQTYLGSGAQVFIPTGNAKQLDSLLRRAAKQLSAELNERIGVAILIEEDPIDPDDPNGRRKLKGQSRVAFAAQSAKKPYTRKPKPNSETPAANN